MSFCEVIPPYDIKPIFWFINLWYTWKIWSKLIAKKQIFFFKLFTLLYIWCVPKLIFTNVTPGDQKTCIVSRKMKIWSFSKQAHNVVCSHQVWTKILILIHFWGWWSDIFSGFAYIFFEKFKHKGLENKVLRFNLF